MRKCVVVSQRGVIRPHVLSKQLGGLRVRRLGTVLLFLVAGQLSLAPAPTWAEPIKFTDLIVFGDSLSDIGNVYQVSTLKISDNTGDLYDGKANFPGPKPPSLSGNFLVNGSLNSNYNYTQKRFTDGADTTPKTATPGVWVEHLAAKLNLAPLKSSADSGHDFAFGGAETNGGQTTIPFTGGAGATTVTSSTVVDNVGRQVDNFLATSVGDGRADNRALYVVWGGGNDLINTADAVIKGTLTADKIGKAQEAAIANITSYIQTLYDVGARYFLWPNLPPIESVPRYKAAAQNVRDKLGSATSAFSTDEGTAIKALATKNAGLTIVPVDVLSLFNDVLKNPADVKYKFENIDTPAMGQANVNPDKYVLWDNIHPTTRTHELIGGAAYNAVAMALCVPEPNALRLVVVAIILAMTARQRRTDLNLSSSHGNT